jgi:hypothetical protein
LPAPVIVFVESVDKEPEMVRESNLGSEGVVRGVGGVDPQDIKAKTIRVIGSTNSRRTRDT